MAEMNPRSIRFTDDDLSWLGRYNQNYGEQTREDLAVLRGLISTAERSLDGKFRINEACLICDVMNRTVFEPHWIHGVAQSIALNVSDGISRDGLDEKWKIVDGQGLVKRIQDLTPLEGYTVWHWCRLFWTNPEYKDKPYDEAVGRLFRVRKEVAKVESE